jgi:hypothetical protein
MVCKNMNWIELVQDGVLWYTYELVVFPLPVSRVIPQFHLYIMVHAEF